jgi:hypothetical protein
MNRPDRGQPTAWASLRAVEISTSVFAGLQGREAWLLDTGHLRDLDLCQARLDSRIAQIAAEYLRRGPLTLRFGRGSLRHSPTVSGFAAEPHVAHCDALAATTPRSPLIVGK